MSDVNEEILDFLKTREAYHLNQGLTQELAQAAAAADLKDYEEDKEEAGEEAYNQLAKAIDMPTILDDFVRRGLGQYKTEWMKVNAPYTIDFKLHCKADSGLGNRANIKGRLIAGASLILECAVNGVWKVWTHKHVSFQHVNEIRQAHIWKTKLYESLLFDFISVHNTHRLIREAQESQVKS
jgi:hypothetical protein